MKKNVLLLCVCILFLFSNAYCASPGTTIFSILKVDPSAYSAAMGGVNGILSSQSVLDDPAVLPFLREGSISAQQLFYISDVSYSMLTYVSPLDEEKALSASVGYVGVGGLNRTIYDSSSLDQYIQSGSFDFSDAICNIGYGQSLSDNFSLGVGLKCIKESIDKNDLFGAMVTMSGYYVPTNNLKVNFGLINLGPQVSGFDLPMGGYFSLGSRLSDDTSWLGEIIGYSDQIVEFHTGLEYNLSGAFSLRAGYIYPIKDQGLGEFPNVDISGGFGLKIGGFTLDYAWVPEGDFGSTHRLTLGARIGPSYKKDQVENNYSLNNPDFSNNTEITNEHKAISIAVINFDAKRVSLVNAYTASSLIRINLNRSNKFKVMDAQHMEDFLGEEKFQGCQTAECAVKIGKALGVQEVIIGTLTRIADVYYVAVNIVDVETGDIKGSLVQDVDNINDLNKACESITNKIIRTH